MRTNKPSKAVMDNAISIAASVLVINKLMLHRAFMAVRSGHKKPGSAVMVLCPNIGLFPIKADSHLHQQLGAIASALTRNWGYSMTYEERGELARYIGKLVSIGKPRLTVLQHVQETLSNQPK